MAAGLGVGSAPRSGEEPPVCGLVPILKTCYSFVYQMKMLNRSVQLEVLNIQLNYQEDYTP